MARVTHEATHVVDDAGPVGERAVDGAEHGVQGAVQPPDLGVRGGASDALVEVALSKTGGGGFHFPQRCEGGCDEQPCERTTEDHHRQPEEQEDGGQPGDRRIRSSEVEADNHGERLCGGRRLERVAADPPLPADRFPRHRDGALLADYRARIDRLTTLAGTVVAQHLAAAVHHREVVIGGERVDAAAHAASGICAELEDLTVVEDQGDAVDLLIDLVEQIVAQDRHGTDARHKQAHRQ